MEGERLPVPVREQLAADGDGLPGLEGRGGQEAGAVALGEGGQTAGVHAGGRSADGDLLELAWLGHPQQADLGVRRGVQGVRQRRDPQLRAGQQVGAVQRARHAPRRRRPAEGGLLGHDPVAADRQRAGARREHHDASEHQPAAQPAVVVWLRSATVLRCGRRRRGRRRRLPFAPIGGSAALARRLALHTRTGVHGPSVWPGRRSLLFTMSPAIVSAASILR